MHDLKLYNRVENSIIVVPMVEEIKKQVIDQLFDDKSVNLRK